MDLFISPSTDRVEQLKRALHQNAAGDGASILMRRGDGSFDGVDEDGEITDREVINAIKSVPCHYAANGTDEQRKAALQLQIKREVARAKAAAKAILEITEDLPNAIDMGYRAATAMVTATTLRELLDTM